jgi:hypothetical protein
MLGYLVEEEGFLLLKMEGLRQLCLPGMRRYKKRQLEINMNGNEMNEDKKKEKRYMKGSTL